MEISFTFCAVSEFQSIITFTDIRYKHEKYAAAQKFKSFTNNMVLFMIFRLFQYLLLQLLIILPQASYTNKNDDCCGNKKSHLEAICPCTFSKSSLEIIGSWLDRRIKEQTGEFLSLKGSVAPDEEAALQAERDLSIHQHLERAKEESRAQKRENKQTEHKRNSLAL